MSSLWPQAAPRRPPQVQRRHDERLCVHSALGHERQLRGLRGGRRRSGHVEAVALRAGAPLRVGLFELPSPPEEREGEARERPRGVQPGEEVHRRELAAAGGPQLRRAPGRRVAGGGAGVGGEPP